MALGARDCRAACGMQFASSDVSGQRGRGSGAFFFAAQQAADVLAVADVTSAAVTTESATNAGAIPAGPTRGERRRNAHIPSSDPTETAE